MSLTNTEASFAENSYQKAYDLLKALAVIPAPSNHEKKRVKFLVQWLKAQEFTQVETDGADNVIIKFYCGESNPIRLFCAHSDVVFPNEEALPLDEDDDILRVPGAGDDTANVVAMLMAAEYLLRHPVDTQGTGIMLVVNSGEEGLGNLRGTRYIMKDYGSRIREFVSFDSTVASVVNNAVGSHRYRVEVLTEGGHSFANFGNKNAIACLTSLIDALYQVKVPEEGKTTFNVGTIQGGTSVNSIAQQAEMLYEYRSDRPENLKQMQQCFERAVADCRNKGVTVNVEMVGERPCSVLRGDPRQQQLTERAAAIIKEQYGESADIRSGSTDANIPLSMGVPAVTIGCARGKGAHTRQEYILKNSIVPGVRVAMDMILWGCTR